MCELIRSVVTEGTAKNAAVAGFSIGGKTGTSEKIDVLDSNGKPTLDKIVSFVGIAPMDDPEYIVLVALDTPSRSTGMYISGGVMAAPTVGAVMEDILPYLGVSRNYTEQDVAGKTVVLPDFVGMTVKDAQKLWKEQSITAQVIGTGDKIVGQIPAAGETVPGGSEILVYLEQVPEQESVKVPNFAGMNRQQASDAAGKLGLYILVKGNPEVSHNVVVISQNVAADTEVIRGSTIELTFYDTKAAT